LANIAADDEWTRLLAIFEHLKRGEQYDALLLDLLQQSENSDIRQCALRILGHAGGRESRLAIGAFFSHPDADTRGAAYDAADFACDLRLVDALLLARRVTKPQERLHVMSAISHLLEREPADLYDDTGDFTSSAYETHAQQRVQALRSVHGADTAVFEGGILSVAYVVERIDALCDSPEAVELGGFLSRYVEMLEGMTGLPAVDTFDDEVNANCVRIRDMVAQFERMGGTLRFEVGQRYFFGHRLPS
jgi:hypothetical protein